MLITVPSCIFGLYSYNMGFVTCYFPFQVSSMLDNTVVTDGDSQNSKLIWNLNYATDVTGDKSLFC